jgi:hypothetical protein
VAGRARTALLYRRVLNTDLRNPIGPAHPLGQHIGSVWLMLSTSTVQHHLRQGPPPSSRGISCGDQRERRGGVRGGAHVG